MSIPKAWHAVSRNAYQFQIATVVANLPQACQSLGYFRDRLIAAAAALQELGHGPDVLQHLAVDDPLLRLNGLPDGCPGGVGLCDDVSLVPVQRGLVWDGL